MPTAARSAGSLTYLIINSGNTTTPFLRACKARGWTAYDKDLAKREATWQANFVWKPTHTSMKPCPSLMSRGNGTLGKRQSVNHLLALEPLFTKNSLFECLLEYYTSIGEDPYKYIPATFLIEPRAREEPASWPGWPAFEEHYRRCAADASLRNLWLMKPTALNRGIGIEVMSSLDDMRAFLTARARAASMGIQPVWIGQKYLERPLLYRGRKWDLRVWALVTDAGDVFMHAPG